MSAAPTLPFTVHYKPNKWITVLLANIVLVAAGVAVVVGGIMQWDAWGWKAIVFVIIGVLVALLGLGNVVGAKSTFSPTDLVAAGVDEQGFILPNIGLVPWSAFTSLDFTYTLGGGSKMILNMIYGMDDRKIVAKLNPEALAPQLRATIEKYEHDAFTNDGMAFGFVTGMVGGTNAYVTLIRAAESTAPQGFPLTVTSKDSSFLAKLEGARTAA
ncbi:MAG: hypothetical protein L0L69_07355 [Propionibacterium sp.]|nr:hypothetical protein [Propionibacterium sp.]